MLSVSVTWAQPLSPAGRKKLDNDIRYLVGQHAGFGQFSVAVADSGGTVSQVSGSTPYPLASVFKLPLLLGVLKNQQEGKFPSLSSSLTISILDQCIGSGRLMDRPVGSTVSVNEAARLMMSISDNTATDLLFRKYGTGNLDTWLHSLGYKSSEILLTNRQAWLLSLGKVPGWGNTTPENRIARWEKLDRAGRLDLARSIEQSSSSLSISKFQAIENASTGTQTAAQDNELASRLDNKMSALDLAGLLIHLDRGTLLGQAQTESAFSILAGQKYHTRLPSKLSASTTVYHKTGTLSGIRNDAGLFHIRGREDGVAVVFLSRSLRPGSEGKADRLAGQIGKLVESAYLAE